MPRAASPPSPTQMRYDARPQEPPPPCSSHLLLPPLPLSPLISSSPLILTSVSKPFPTGFQQTHRRAVLCRLWFVRRTSTRTTTTTTPPPPQPPPPRVNTLQLRLAAARAALHAPLPSPTLRSRADGVCARWMQRRRPRTTRCSRRRGGRGRRAGARRSGRRGRSRAGGSAGRRTMASGGTGCRDTLRDWQRAAMLS